MQKLSLKTIILTGFIVSLNMFSSSSAQEIFLSNGMNIQEVKALAGQSSQKLTLQQQQELLDILERLEKLNLEELNQVQTQEELETIICLPSFKKLAAISIRIALAMYFWQKLHPMLKENFPGNETVVELPKVIAGALIIDSIKDFFKEIKNSVENTVSNVYDIVAA